MFYTTKKTASEAILRIVANGFDHCAALALHQANPRDTAKVCHSLRRSFYLDYKRRMQMESRFTRRKSRIVVSALCSSIFLLFGCGQSSPPSSGQRSSAESAKPKVQYEIIQERKIPNGGYSRVVVVSASLRTEDGLLSLANQILRDTKGDRNAHAFIYDDRQAGMQRDAALNERLSASDIKQHDDHMIGSYWRNANTGYHAITINLQGLNGTQKEISL